MTRHDLSEPGDAGVNVRVYASCDLEHDGDLLNLLLAQAAEAASGFDVTATSTVSTADKGGEERLRAVIRSVDQVIVICGEHTEGSYPVSIEVRVAQEEKCPYLLLWGRRRPMCQKPSTAKPADPMYSWTPDVIAQQILQIRRRHDVDDEAARLRRPKT